LHDGAEGLADSLPAYPPQAAYIIAIVRQASADRRSNFTFSGNGFLKPQTLALLWQNLFAPVFFKNLLSAIWALLRRRPKDEIDDGVTYGGQGWLRRRSVDSFFPPRVCEATMLQEGVSYRLRLNKCWPAPNGKP